MVSGMWFAEKPTPKPRGDEMKIKEIRDNGGKTFDRYVVLFDTPRRVNRVRCYLDGVSMSDNPKSPQGMCNHGIFQPGKHLGKRIELGDLPPDCREIVMRELEEVTE